MKIYIDSEAPGKCKYFHLLLDNDFLSELFKDKDVLEAFLLTFHLSPLTIDPLTEFEFLRDVFEPVQRSLKERFINKPIFHPLPNRQDIFTHLQENALLLSKIYSQRGHNKNTKISLVDLFLGARCMLNAGTLLLITGNKKDFPISAFKIIGVINIEQNDGNLKPYTIVQFDKENFAKHLESFKKMEKQYEAQINEEGQEEDNLPDDIPF